MITVLVKEPTKKEYVTSVQNTFESFQKIVNGCFELVGDTPFEGIDILVPDEGKLRNDKPNFWINENTRFADLLFGTVIFIRHDVEGRTTSLTEEDVLHIICWLKARRQPVGNEVGADYIRWEVI